MGVGVGGGESRKVKYQWVKGSGQSAVMAQLKHVNFGLIDQLFTPNSVV